tara:strand:- start:118 stop:498 length:381 start_codon:yes stop_codon:yes gene_type:complete
MSDSLEFDLSSVPPDLLPALEKEFREGRLKQHVDAQSNAAQRIGSSRETDYKSVNGLGRLRLRIDPYTYHYFGQRLGYNCWHNEQFLREFERDNEYARVNCGGTKIQAGYGSKQPKFRKKYGVNKV